MGKSMLINLHILYSSISGHKENNYSTRIVEINQVKIPLLMRARTKTQITEILLPTIFTINLFIFSLI